MIEDGCRGIAYDATSLNDPIARPTGVVVHDPRTAARAARPSHSALGVRRAQATGSYSRASGHRIRLSERVHESDQSQCGVTRILWTYQHPDNEGHANIHTHECRARPSDIRV